MEQQPSLAGNSSVRESRRSDDKTWGRSLTRSTRSEPKLKESRTYSHSKSSRSRLQQSKNNLQAVEENEEVEPMLHTNQEQQKKFQTANQKLSTVPEDEDKDEEVSDEQITLLATTMQPYHAHNKAQHFFEVSDSDSGDFDGYGSSTSDGLDEELEILKSDDAVAVVIQPRKKAVITRKVSSKHSALAKGKEKVSRTQRLLREDDPETCSELMIVSWKLNEIDYLPDQSS